MFSQTEITSVEFFTTKHACQVKVFHKLLLLWEAALLVELMFQLCLTRLLWLRDVAQFSLAAHHLFRLRPVRLWRRRNSEVLICTAKSLASLTISHSLSFTLSKFVDLLLLISVLKVILQKISTIVSDQRSLFFLLTNLMESFLSIIRNLWTCIMYLAEYLMVLASTSLKNATVQHLLQALEISMVTQLVLWRITASYSVRVHKKVHTLFSFAHKERFRLFSCKISQVLWSVRR